MDINANCIVHAEVTIEPGTFIGEYSVVGGKTRPTKFNRQSWDTRLRRCTLIESNTYIGTHCIIEEGTIIRRNSIIESTCVIENDVLIGEGSIIIRGAKISSHSKIGSNCVISGFVGERTVVGNHSRFFGKCVHKQWDTSKHWDDNIEGAPVILEHAFIGENALIIGAISIGNFSYIAAGAIVSRDVPDSHIAFGTNEICHIEEWKHKPGRHSNEVK